jgi:FtsH-binding integral membrane protein
MLTSRFVRPISQILPQLVGSRKLIVRNKWDSAKKTNVYNLITNPDKIKIDIAPVPSDITDSISLYDYAKMTLTQTSTNLLGIGVATGVSIFTGTTLISSEMSDPIILGAIAMIGGFAGSIYSIIKMHHYTPDMVYNETEKKYNIIDNQTRKNFLYGLIASQGLLITPFMMVNTEYIVPAVFMTTAITAGPVMYAYMNPTKNISGIGNFLYSSLVGMCTIGITGIIFPSLGHIWYQPEPYIGILIMSGYNWYDTQCIINSYNEKKLDPIGHSVNYTLNFINILIRVIELMARRNRK